MKKLVFLLLSVWAISGYGQVRNYTFSQQTNVPYQEITDGTLLGGTTILNNEFFADGTTTGSTTVAGDGFPIGFNFVFNGQVYDRFGVSNEGWISLGNSSITPKAVDLTVGASYRTMPLESTTQINETLCARIAALAADLQGQTGSSLSYKLVQASPNNYLVIQWKNYRKNGSASGDSFNFQIRLYQNTNEIKILYNNFTSDTNSGAVTFQVGLRAEPSSVTPVKNYSNVTSSGTWLASTAGTSPSAKMPMSNTNVPGSGFAFSWTPGCGAPKNLVISNVTTSTATLSWGNYGPIPNGPDSYEYLVSTSSAIPASTTFGTAVNTSTINLTSSVLSPNTNYFVFIRSKCGAQTMNWDTYLGSFKTKCMDQATFFESFDTYTTGIVPDCWDQVGTNTLKVASASVSPGSPPNKLTFGVGAGATSYSYAVLPSVSNLANDTHQLRFKALASVTSNDKTIDVGYFTDVTQTNFVSVLPNSVPFTLPAGSASPAQPYQEFQVVPGVLLDIKNLVLRIGGLQAAYTVFIDDVVWEPKPNCTASVSMVTANNFTNNSAVINWEKGNSTKWQYAFSSSVLNPYNLNALDVNGIIPVLNLTGLSPATTYRVWIRSVCNTSNYGAWIGPVTVVTTCDPLATMVENFDSTNVSAIAPACWAKISAASGTVSVTNTSTPAAPSLGNVLQIDAGSTQTVVMLRPLGNVRSGINQMKLKVAVVGTGTPAAIPTGAQLEIGYLTDITNVNSFVSLQQDVTPTTVNAFEQKLRSFGSNPQSDYLAFRATKATFYIDDVIWEPIPSNCSSEIAVNTAQVNENTAVLKWNQGTGGETQWQYAIGSPTDTDPNTLTAKSFTTITGPNAVGIVTGTIGQLTPSTSYKVWIRAFCDPANPGAYSAPYIITTSCSGVTGIDENFDSSPTLPSCWYKAGNTGGVSVTGDSGAASLPYILRLSSSSTTGPAVIALPALSNVGANNYRLTFRYKTTYIGTVSFDVGCLKNIGDVTTFVPLGNPLVCDNTYKYAVISFDTAPATNILAIRYNNTTSASMAVNIDNVKWSPAPQCADVSGLKFDSSTHDSVSFSWTAGGNETKWDYVVGDANASNPDALTPKEATSPNVTVSQLSGGAPLQPNTKYKIWVRPKCFDAGSNLFVPGNYLGALDVFTECAPQSTFFENFNGTPSGLPVCWKKIGTTGTAYTMTSTQELADKLKLYMVATNADSSPVVSMPPIDPASFADHILKFRMMGLQDGSSVQVGFVINGLGSSSFEPMHTFIGDSSPVSDVFTYKFEGTPLSNTIGFRVAGDAGLNSVYIDDVSWMPLPSGVPACADVTAVPDAECGNYATHISWPAVPGADGYLFSLGTSSGQHDLKDQEDIKDVLSITLKGDYNKTYYYTVVPYNYLGRAVGCSEKMFLTNPKGCYCISNPLTKDGNGIDDIVFGDSHFHLSSLTYNSLTAKPANVLKENGINMNLKFSPSAANYNVAVWVDLNDDFYFSDSENLYTGTGSTEYINQLNALISIPTDAAYGLHRMRIIGRKDDGVIDPCYSGNNAATIDCIINIIKSPAVNDEPDTAVNLTVGSSFSSNAVDGTNENATGSYNVVYPGCGNYFGGDVWFKAVVPPSGKLIFEVNGKDGGLTDTAGAVYFSQDNILQQLQCNDSSSLTSGNHPKISVTDWTPGANLYFRVWDNGGTDYGSFRVSAYDTSSLTTEPFDMMHFEVYPNPVKDVLNVSLDKDISSVAVVNMLGQVVISQSVGGTKAAVDMSGLSVGAYLVKVIAGNQTKMIKVIKE